MNNETQRKKDLGLRTFCQRSIVGKQLTLQACCTVKSYPK